MTGVHKAVQAAGSQRALAKACGVQEAAVSKWVKWGHVPQAQVLPIHRRYGIAISELVSPRVRAMMQAEGRA